MADNLEIIKRIIEEHRAIKYHMKLAGDSITDREALALLEKACADFIPGRSSTVSETHTEVQQAIYLLEAGLNTHFYFEEKYLPPLLGEIIFNALVLEHKEILAEIERAKSTVAHIHLEGLSREDLMRKEGDIQQSMNGVRELVEEHAAREETVLEMLRHALEEHSG